MSTAATKKQKVTKSGKQANSPSGSSLREKQRRGSKSSTSRLVLRKGNEPLSQQDIDLLEKLRSTPKRPIDLSDIPEIKENTFANRSGILSLFKPYKLQITLRLDADVIAWAKRGGVGYQSRINAALRAAMSADSKAHSKT